MSSDSSCIPGNAGAGWAKVWGGGAALLLLVAGCLSILRPFLSAVLWAAIVCSSTWPLFAWLRQRVGGHRTLAALLMTVGLTLVLAAPFALVGWSIAEEVKGVVAAAHTVLDEGPAGLTQWAERLPWFYSELPNSLARFSGADNATARVEAERRVLSLLRRGLMRVGRAVGHGVVQLCLSLLIGFFIYRDGDELGARLAVVATRLAGTRGWSLLAIAHGTVRGVVYGILGTALVHSLVVTLGLWMAGVPGVFLFGFSTMLLSLIPFGPTLVWLPAALWLLHQGQRGDAIFLLVWGLVANSVVDSLVRPLLISRGGHVPLLIVILGVFGGAAAFGFIGVFLGPALLAVGWALLDGWSAAGGRDLEAANGLAVLTPAEELPPIEEP